MSGLYPIVGWKIKNHVVFLAEGLCSDTGTVLEWAKSIGTTNPVVTIALEKYSC